MCRAGSHVLHPSIRPAETVRIMDKQASAPIKRSLHMICCLPLGLALPRQASSHMVSLSLMLAGLRRSAVVTSLSALARCIWPLPAMHSLQSAACLQQQLLRGKAAHQLGRFQPTLIRARSSDLLNTDMATKQHIPGPALEVPVT